MTARLCARRSKRAGWSMGSPGGSPLETWQKLDNAWTGSVRSPVERAHATMKRWYGMGRVRYLGLSRNACHLRFVVTAMNMKRALVLMEEKT